MVVERGQHAKTVLPLGMIAWFYVFSDSLTQYILKVYFFSLPSNAFIPVFLVALIVTLGIGKTLPKIKVLFFLILGVIGFILGVLVNEDLGIDQILRLGGAVSSLLIGYILFNNTDSKNSVTNLYILAVSLYAIVCIVALSRYFPTHFPVIDKLIDRGGVIVRRPEIMTDQNWQVLYFIPIAALWSINMKLYQWILTLVITVSALYTLSQLQTRSGVIILLLLIFVSLSMSLFRKDLGRTKAVIIPLVTIVTLFIYQNEFREIFSVIIDRFSSDTTSTMYGRLESALFFFNHIFNLNYWVPAGSQEFLNKYGNYPHFNLTQIYLDAGILGVIMWIALFVIPIVSLAKYVLIKKSDEVSVIVFICGIGVIVVQSTLSVSLNEQIWLWAGAVLGTMNRLNRT